MVVRTQIAQVLLAVPDIYPYALEQKQHLGRHLVRSESRLAKANVDAIIQAAEVERALLNFRRSRRRYESALRYLEATTPRHVEVSLEIVRLMIIQGDLSDAEKLLQRMLASIKELITQGGESKRRGEKLQYLALREQARLYVRYSKFGKALETAEKAKELCEGTFFWFKLRFQSSQIPYGFLVGLYQDIAEINLKLKNLKGCADSCKRAKELAVRGESITREHLTHRASFAFAEMYASTNDFEIAAKWYRQAIDNFHEAEGDRTVARAANALAQINVRLKNVTAAKELYGQAMLIFKGIGDDRGLISSHMGLARIAFDEKQRSEAAVHYENVLELLEISGLPIEQWETYRNLAHIHFWDKKILKARDYWIRMIQVVQASFKNKFLEIYRRDTEIKRDFDLCILLDEELKKLGDNIGETEILEYAQLLSTKTSVVPRDQLKICGSLASLYRQMGKLDEALDELEMAIEVITDNLVVAELCEQGGDYAAQLYSPNHQISTSDNEKLERLPDRAENYYIQSTIQYLDAGYHSKAYQVYGKLLRRLIFDRAGLLLIPRVHLLILKSFISDQESRMSLAHQAQSVLSEFSMSIEIGDIWAYTGQTAFKNGSDVASNTATSTSLNEETLKYYRLAEEAYEKAETSERIRCLDTLIPAYFKMQLIDDVRRLAIRIFELHGDLDNIDGFQKAYARLFLMRDKLDAKTFLDSINRARNVVSRMSFNKQDDARFAFKTGQLLHSVADLLYGDKDAQRKYLLMSMKEFDLVLSFHPDVDLMSSVLNDKAICLIDLGRLQKACDLFNEALRITSDDKSADRGVLMCNAGSLLIRMEEHEKGMALYLGGVKLLQKIVDEFDHLMFSGNVPSSQQIFSMRHTKRALASVLQSLDSERYKPRIEQLYREADGAPIVKKEDELRFDVFLEDNTAMLPLIETGDGRQFWPISSSDSIKVFLTRPPDPWEYKE